MPPTGSSPAGLHRRCCARAAAAAPPAARRASPGCRHCRRHAGRLTWWRPFGPHGASRSASIIASRTCSPVAMHGTLPDTVDHPERTGSGTWGIGRTSSACHASPWVAVSFSDCIPCPTTGQGQEPPPRFTSVQFNSVQNILSRHPLQVKFNSLLDIPRSRSNVRPGRELNVCSRAREPRRPAVPSNAPVEPGSRWGRSVRRQTLAVSVRMPGRPA